MLTQSTLPSSIEAALSFVSDHSKLDLLCDPTPISESWQKSPKCDEHQGSISTWEEKEIAADSQTSIHSRTCSKLSTVSNMCASSAPDIVYKRRRLQKNSPDIVYKRRRLQRNSLTLLSAQETNGTEGSDGCLSNVSFEAPSLAAENDDPLGSQIKNDICGQLYLHKLDDVPCTKINKTKGVKLVSKSKSKSKSNGYLGGEELVFDKAPNNAIYKSALEHCIVNDSCSSSKSDIDDSGDCSSSALLTTVLSGGNISEKELCISILRSHGLLKGVFPISSCTSNDILGINGGSNCSQSCKICGGTENPKNMLICDSCEGAFHVFCCNPRVKKISVEEWYCQPCSRKKHKLSLENTTGNGEESTNRNGISKRKSSPISFMLRNSEQYTTGVRVGKGFQAEVPDWSGPISNSNDYNFFGEPLEMDPTKYCSLYEWNIDKSSTPKSIGNWLQCREVLDDDTGTSSKGTICGKWRRAPLFEVQTDDWDCSCSVLWDPIHADCAVPQELETDQVLMHLKYVELLRPRLCAKKQKLGLSKSETEDIRSKTSKNGDDP